MSNRKVEWVDFETCYEESESEEEDDRLSGNFWNSATHIDEDDLISDSEESCTSKSQSNDTKCQEVDHDVDGDSESKNDENLERTKTESKKCRSPRTKTMSLEEWKKLIDSFADSFLAYLAVSKKIPLTPSEELVAVSCSCQTEKTKAEVNLFFFEAVKENYPVFYCQECSTLPSTLIEMGLFPLSPVEPTSAVHFSVCDLMLRLKNVCALGGKMISDFYNPQIPLSNVKVSARDCSNVVLHFTEMKKVANEKKEKTQ